MYANIPNAWIPIHLDNSSWNDSIWWQDFAWLPWVYVSWRMFQDNRVLYCLPTWGGTNTTAGGGQQIPIVLANFAHCLQRGGQGWHLQVIDLRLRPRSCVCFVRISQLTVCGRNATLVWNFPIAIEYVIVGRVKITFLKRHLLILNLKGCEGKRKKERVCVISRDRCVTWSQTCAIGK